jgi:3',5'-cyclic AMP phosphodiesterase CpdA
MNLNYRFAIVSDPHIALPETIWDHPSRFHLVEISIPALERVLQHLETLDLDFLLLPGDLTQHGEPQNHLWLQKRLKLLPFPVYVIPGNHDLPTLLPTDRSIGFHDFPYYYQDFGYQNPEQLYYSCEVKPGLHLIGLNSNQFNEQGKQIGCLDEAQLIWLENTLQSLKNQLVIVMIHHNVIEHLPGQSEHELGKRYMLDNANILLDILEKFKVNLIFTGHLHVQDLAQKNNIYEITTGSLVSYPHPYRVLELTRDHQGKVNLKIESFRVTNVSGWENLLETSKEWMGDRSYHFMMRLLTGHPLYLPSVEAEKIAPKLRYFWANIAEGDTIFDFPDFPPQVRHYFRYFSAIDLEGKPNLVDNQANLFISDNF